ncbi:MAG: metallophosphoesterase [Planctomycetota bacterium]
MATAFWIAAFFGHGALWVELVNRLHGLGWQRKLIDAATVFCSLACAGVPLVGAGLLIAGYAPRWLVGYGWLSIGVLAIVLLTRAGLHWDPRRDTRTKRVQSSVLDLRQRLGEAATGSDRLHKLAKLPGNQLLKPRVEAYDIPIERLPSALEGLRIAHLTDLHMSGRLTIGYFQEILREVQAWEPDLVCVTGDIVEHMPQMDWIDDTLGTLSPRYGSYFILGNHDTKIDSDALRERLTTAGLHDVGGKSIEVSCGGTTLQICGDERPWFSAAPPIAENDETTLCLAHTPDRFGWAIRNRVDLLLAGHNHGGQVCFPLWGALLCPSRHGVRYAAGTFRAKQTVMHVGRGTGSLFPLRYLCPPEVALITLTRG